MDTPVTVSVTVAGGERLLVCTVQEPAPLVRHEAGPEAPCQANGPSPPDRIVRGILHPDLYEDLPALWRPVEVTDVDR